MHIEVKVEKKIYINFTDDTPRFLIGDPGLEKNRDWVIKLNNIFISGHNFKQAVVAVDDEEGEGMELQTVVSS